MASPSGSPPNSHSGKGSGVLAPVNSRSPAPHTGQVTTTTTVRGTWGTMRPGVSGSGDG
ncbi:MULTISPECIES: hypothetical protein [unclassified Streptomyces]|uniref:hypothetical protein n=1 Tax=unclassified Streptomyces TaxID=2593676 RepID=UPI0013145242|nr:MULTISPECIES: hypothetical protein [unclassified Streptomyces]